MKNILKRNKITIILGLALAIIFAVIIVMSQGFSTDIILTPAKRNESFNVNKKDEQNTQVTSRGEAPTNIDFSDPPNFEEIKTQDAPKNILDEEKQTLPKVEPLRISYTNEGFIPKNPKAVKGQKVIWTNNSAVAMKIKQITELFDNLPETINILPGETYELELTEDGIWFYKETVNDWVGRITIYDR